MLLCCLCVISKDRRRFRSPSASVTSRWSRCSRTSLMLRRHLCIKTTSTTCFRPRPCKRHLWPTQKMKPVSYALHLPLLIGTSCPANFLHMYVWTLWFYRWRTTHHGWHVVQLHYHTRPSWRLHQSDQGTQPLDNCPYSASLRYTTSSDLRHNNPVLAS